MKAKIIFVALLSFPFCLLSSQVPQGFNYQAAARDGAGQPIKEVSLPVRITIQTSLSGGTILWQETRTALTDVFGVMSFVVGGPGGVRTGGVPNFSDISWASQTLYIKTEIRYPITNSDYTDLGTTQIWSVPYSLVSKNLQQPVDKLTVRGNTSSFDEALFEVKNNTGQTILAVYNEGVRIYVDDGAKGSKGGFAVGGFGLEKDAFSDKYMDVSREGVNIYLDTDPLTKTKKGGFAVGSLDMAKGTVQKLLDVNMDCVRVFIDDLPGKPTKGGFAVSGFETGKGPDDNFLKVDLTKIKAGKVEYINLTPQNTFIGELAGKNNALAGDNGAYNSFIGYQSGFNNTSGHHNTYIGWKAGYNVGPDAHYNIFIGNSTGYNNYGSNNIFIGDRSGNRNTSGTQNVFIGLQAGQKNKTGNNNMFLGSNAGQRDSTGSNNTFVGTAAGQYNIVGSDNVYMGWRAGNVNNAGSNVMIGVDAGSLATGSNNVFLGYQAGYNANTGGSGSLFLGYQAGYYETGSNKLYITNIKGTNLADGKAKALIYGEFDNKIVTINDVLILIPRATAPASPVNGMIYINSTDNHIYCRINGAWKQLD
jgi:hypothetical protein